MFRLDREFYQPPLRFDARGSRSRCGNSSRTITAQPQDADGDGLLGGDGTGDFRAFEVA